MSLRRLALSCACVLALAQPVHAESRAMGASAPLRAAIDEPALRGHLEALQSVAEQHGGNRAAGTPGYAQSVAYIVRELEAAGYAVTQPTFSFPKFEQASPPRLVAAGEAISRDLHTLMYSGAGTVRAPLAPVDLALGDPANPGPSTSGCEAEDWAGFPRDAVALVRRGTCPFQAKVENAVRAGAAAVVVMNEGREGRTGAVRGRLMRTAPIPVVSVPYAEGLTLAARAGAEAELSVDARTVEVSSSNVVTQTDKDGPVVVLGAHLDSVPEGPGINDNGSGSAAVLEVARQLARTAPELKGRVRFAFWGAEEIGLVGSRAYVDSLEPSELRRIRLYINLDMVGSPNPGRFVYGEGEGEAVARAYFAELGLPVRETRWGGGSDHAPFAAKQIPVVGLTTGAYGNQSEADAALFGGRAGASYDPCYHQACDTVANIDLAALAGLTDAAAHIAVTVIDPKPDAPLR